MTSDDKTIANMLQCQFMSAVGTKSARKVIHHRGPFVSNTFQFHNVSEQLICDLILSLDSNKCAGYDDISPIIWKSVCDEISSTICQLVNQMIDESEFPDVLKIAKVIPVHKKGSKTDIQNYRPISILPIISKIFERLIYMQLDDFFETNSIHDEYQFGFRSGRGCQDAISQVMFNVSKEVDAGNGVVLLSLDISKAFDSLSHEILLRKLEFMGIRGPSNNLIKSYLSNRCQFVDVNSSLSDIQEINKGTSQGSLLGPILFNLMLIDMKNLKCDSKIIKYADDAAVIFKVTDEIFNDTQRLQLLLNELIDFYTSNELAINCEKSYYMCMGKPEMEAIKIILNSAGFKNGCEITYLGIILDDKLQLGPQVDTLVTKLNQGIGAISYMKDKLPTVTLRQFYFGHIHSHLMYCSFILLRCNKAHLKRLQRIQNRALKLVYRLPIRYSTSELFANYANEVLPVKGIIYYSCVLNIKKNIISNSPARLPINFLRSNRLYLLRSHTYKTKIMQNDLCCAGIKIFNNLPSKIKEITQFGTFKQAVKSYLLDHAEDLLHNDDFLLN